MPETNIQWDDEMLRVLGSGLVKYNEDRAGLGPTCFLTDEQRHHIQAKISQDRDAYIACVKFLGQFEDGMEKDCSHWFDVPPIEVASDTNEVRLEAPSLCEDFMLHWDEREIEPDYDGGDTEIHVLQGPAKSNLTVFYPFDPTKSKEEREYTDVPFWLVDWGGRHIYRRDMPMSDVYVVKQGIFALIRATGSFANAHEWCRAMSVYRAAYREAHPFNPLADIL